MKKATKQLIIDSLLCTALTLAIFFMCLYALNKEDELAESNPVEQPEVHVLTVDPTPEPIDLTEDVQDTEEEKQQSEAQIVAIYNVPLDAELQLFIIRLCEEHHIDSAVVMSIIETESMYQADVMGDSGRSYGLMQIQQQFHKERMDKLGVTDLTDPYQNVAVGIDVLAELVDKYEGNVEMALVAYNAGIVGANEHWFSKGIYTSEYSRKVLGKIENLTEGMIEMQYSGDPIADFEAHDAEEVKWLEQRPVCADCGEHIQEESAFYINDDWICEDCIDGYRRDVPDED